MLKLVEDGVLKTWLLDCATARELDLKTTGHAQRGVSSVPSPGPSNLYLAPGAKSPDELIAEIEDGFYVTDLIGMGVNLVTGDYSRGAAGFWIENGERTYPVSEVTIAGHLSEMFASLTPANDLSFRYGTNAPTLARGGPDCCRPLRLTNCRNSRQRLAAGRARGRRAGASLFQTPLKNWTKGPTASPVSEADIAVNDLLRERLTAAPGVERIGFRLAVGGKRRRSDAACTHAMSGSSIRSTARAPISRGCRIGRCRRRWSRTAGRSRPAFTRRSATSSSWPAPTAAPRATARRSRRRQGAELEGCAHRRAEKPPGTACRRGAAVYRHAAGALAGAAACRRRARHLRRRLCRRQQPRLGPCGGRSFGARSGRRTFALRGRNCDL